MANELARDPETLQKPAIGAVLLSGGSDSDMTVPCRGFSFAAAGAIKVTTVAGDSVVIPSGALAAGIIHPIHCTRIWATGTGATGIVAYY